MRESRPPELSDMGHGKRTPIGDPFSSCLFVFPMKIIRLSVRAVSLLNKEAVLTTNTEYTEKVFGNLAMPYKDKMNDVQSTFDKRMFEFRICSVLECRN